MARYFWRQLRVVLLGFFIPLLLCIIMQHHQTQASDPTTEEKTFTLEEASDELNYYLEWCSILTIKGQNEERIKELSNEVEDILKDDILNQSMTVKPDDKLSKYKQEVMQDFLRYAKNQGFEHKLGSASKMVALAQSRVVLYGKMIHHVLKVKNAKWPQDAMNKVVTLKKSYCDFEQKYKAKHFGENWDEVEADQADVDTLEAAINAAKEAILMMLKVKPSTSDDVTTDLPVRVETPSPPTPVQAKADIITELPVHVKTPPPPTAFKKNVDITTVVPDLQVSVETPPTSVLAKMDITTAAPDLPVRVETPQPTAFKTKVDITTELQVRVVTPPTLTKPGLWDKTREIIKNPAFYVPAGIGLLIALTIFYMSGNNPNLPSGAVTDTINGAFTAVTKGFFSPLLAAIIITLVVAILTGGALYYCQKQRQASVKKSIRKRHKQKKSIRKRRKQESIRKRRKQEKSQSTGMRSKLTTQSPNQGSELMIQSTGKSSLMVSTTTSPSVAPTKATRKLKSPIVNNFSKIFQFVSKTNMSVFKADSKLKSQQLDSSFWKDPSKKHSKKYQLSPKTSLQVDTTRSSPASPVLVVNKQKMMKTQATTTTSPSFASTKAVASKLKSQSSGSVIKQKTKSAGPSSALTPVTTSNRH